MDTFDAAVRNWLDAKLPEGSSVDDLDEIHADLVLIDTWVADSVLPYLRANVWSPAVPDVLAGLAELDNVLATVPAAFGHDQTVLRYRSYVEILRRVYEAFLARGGSADSG